MSAASPARRLPSLDVVRAVLSLLVLAYHVSGTIALPKYFGVDAFARLFAVGNARIPLFFALSGFLLTALNADSFGRRDRLAGFLWKRGVRILPPYWIALATVAAVAAMVPDWSSKVPSDPTVLLRAFLLLPLPPDVGGPTGAPLIITAWTLHYELVFYGVIAAFIASRALGVAAVALLAVNGLACHGGGCGFYADFLANRCLGYFVAGAAAAWLVRKAPTMQVPRGAIAAAVAGYGVVAACETVGVAPSGAVVEVAYALLGAALVGALALRDRQRPAARSSRPVRTLADASYALYLLHFPLISLGCKVAVASGLRGPVGAAVAFVAIFAGCVVAAIAFRRVVERPLQDRLTAASRPVAPAVS